MLAVLRRLEGHFTLVFAHADDPGTIIAARGRPRWWSASATGEMFIGSDVAAFIEFTRDAVDAGSGSAVVDHRRTATRSPTSTAMTNRECACFSYRWDCPPRKGRLRLLHAQGDREQPRRSPTPCSDISWDGRIVLDEQRLSDQELREVDKVFIVACGTAIPFGLLAMYAIEHWTLCRWKLNSPASFRYRDPCWIADSLVIAISQSGETADTLEAVRHAKSQKAKVLAICNTNGSQIPGEADAVLYTRAGPEIGGGGHQDVPRPDRGRTTWSGLALAQLAAPKSPTRSSASTTKLSRCPTRSPWVLDHMEPITKLGQQFASSRDGAVPGSATSATRWPSRGALKLKELAYMHAEGFAPVSSSTAPSRSSKTACPSSW